MNIIPKIQRSVSLVSLSFKRNIGIMAVLAQKSATDPIQKLFVQSVKEYGQKAKGAKGGLVEPTPEIEKELKSELDRVAKIYGGGAGTDMTKFPTFDFKEPVLDPINQQQQTKQ